MRSNVEYQAIRPKKQVQDVETEEMECRPCVDDGEGHPDDRDAAKTRIRQMLDPLLPNNEELNCKCLTFTVSKLV